MIAVPGKQLNKVLRDISKAVAVDIDYLDEDDRVATVYQSFRATQKVQFAAFDIRFDEIHMFHSLPIQNIIKTEH